MTDLAPLHRRLLRALDVTSLLVLGAALAPACATTHDEEVAKVGATKTDATKHAWRELVDPLLAALRAGMQPHGRPVDHGRLA